MAGKILLPCSFSLKASLHINFKIHLRKPCRDFGWRYYEFGDSLEENGHFYNIESSNKQDIALHLYVSFYLF